MAEIADIRAVPAIVTMVRAVRTWVRVIIFIMAVANQTLHRTVERMEIHVWPQAMAHQPARRVHAIIYVTMAIPIMV